MKRLIAKSTCEPQGGSGGVRAIRITTNVLHVDDDPKDIELLCAAVRKANLHWGLQHVEDGEEAIQYLTGADGYSDRERHPLPDMVLLDLKMPRLTGFEVLKWIRRHKALFLLPVIIFSGSALQEDVRQAYQAGATSFIIKPLGFQALVKLLKDLRTGWHGPMNVCRKAKSIRAQAMRV